MNADCAERSRGGHGGAIRRAELYEAFESMEAISWEPEELVPSESLEQLRSATAQRAAQFGQIVVLERQHHCVGA